MPAIKFFIKKTINNRRRLFTLLSGMILTLSLFAGITLYVNQTSKGILTEFYAREEADFIVDTGLIDPVNASQTIQQLADNGVLKTIDKIVPFYSWHISAIDWNWYIDAMGIRNRTPGDYGRSPAPIISCLSNFYETLGDHYIKMKNGTWDLSSHYDSSYDRTYYNVVVTESFLKRGELESNQNIVGGEFFTWSWMYIKNANWQDNKSINDVKYCRIVGVIDSSSPIFELSAFSPLLFSRGMFTSPEVRPPFFNDAVFQLTEVGMARLFTFNALGTFKKSALNPDDSLTAINNLNVDNRKIYSYLYDNNNNETYAQYMDSTMEAYHSVSNTEILELLEEYSYWYYAALPKFLIFSSPIFFLGIYILNFAVRYTMKERSKEISSLKSRGFTNRHIWTMLLFENTATTILSAIIGLFLGQILSGVLTNDQDNLIYTITHYSEKLTNAEAYTIIDVILLLSTSALALRYLIKLFKGHFIEMQASNKKDVYLWNILIIEGLCLVGTLWIATATLSLAINLLTKSNVTLESIGAYSSAIISFFLDTTLLIFTKFVTLLQSNPFSDLLVLMVAGWILLMVISIAPTIRIINLDIDVLARNEEIVAIEASEQKIFLYNSKLLAIGLFFIIGLPTIGMSAFDNSFLLALGIIIFTIFLIGGINFMSQISRLLPYFIDKITDNPQIYILSREMKRLSKRSSAAFVVLSLTMAFGIISASIIDSGRNYYVSNASFEIGSDANVAIVSSSWRYGSIYNATYQNLANKTLYPEIESASPLYHDTGYLLDPGEDFPSSHIWTYSVSHKNLYVLFIDATSFSKTAFFQNYFVKSYNTGNLFRPNYEDLLAQMSANPTKTCIMDSQTAKSLEISVNSPVRFTVGGRVTFNILKCDTKLLGTVDYWAPNLRTGSNPFVIVDYRIINNENAFGTNTPLSNVLVKFTAAFKTTQHSEDWGTVFTNRLQAEKTSLLPGISIEESKIVQLQLSSKNLIGRDFATLMNLASLDFYYALLVSGIGFLLVLEIKTVEKKKDIGSLKALGFGNRETFNLILFEGLISIIAASVAGLIIGAFCAQLINYLFIPDLLLPKVFVLSIELLSLQLLLGITGAILGVVIPAYLTKRFTISELISGD